MAIKITENGVVRYENEPNVDRLLFPNVEEGISSEQIKQAVDEWLEDHPEATTTVMDGSISKAKLDSNLRTELDSMDSEIGELNENLSESVGDLKADLSESVGDLKADLSDVNERLDSEIADVKNDLRYTDSVIQNNVAQLYGKNLFDPLSLIADGITNEPSDIYGKSADFVTNIGTIPLVIPVGTNFIVSFDAYVEPVQNSAGSGLVFKVLRNDGTTLSQQIAIPNNTASWATFTMTPNKNYGANGIQFAVSAYGNNITHLRNIQVEYGTTKTDYENPLTAYDKKAEADNLIMQEGLTNLSSELNVFKNNILDIIHTDLLYGKTPVFGTYCNPMTGEIRTLNFWSVIGITLPNGVQHLWPYNANDTVNNALRSVCFYSSLEQNTSTFISGVSGSASVVANGITVPGNAVSCAVSIGNSETLALEYYLSTTQGGDETRQYLGESILVKDSQITGLNVPIPVQLANRKPTFCFIFDDGTDGDINVKSFFDSYGFKCGFALIGDDAYLTANGRKERYLSYQREGYEILSHSINATAFSTVTDLATAENYLRNSLSVLTNNGFDVTGWVTPSTWMLTEQLPLVCKYYQYGYGHLQGTPEGTPYHQFIGLDIRQLDRWGLEGKTIEQTMTAINNAITNNAYMIFYGHSYPSTDNNMTVANMKTILDFLKTKVTNGEVIVDTPRNTIDNYYSFRHSDLLDLYNQINA